MVPRTAIASARAQIVATMRVKWALELDGEVYMIELDHGDYSGRKTIKQVRGPR